MKKLIYLFIPFAIYSCGGESTETEETTDESAETTENVVEDEAEEENKPRSPRMQIEEEMDGLTIGVDYGSPRVRERVIWGELVPYDKVWRAGANEVTALTVSSDVTFGSENLAAGTYGLFILPKAEGDWTVILNEEWSNEEHGVWGSSTYKEEKDVLRLDVTPEWAEESQEELSYTINENSELVFAWEKAILKIAISAAMPA
jgi:hypothetical protein